jgi:CRP/FNR family transcriptional regulator, cyclic AMP receptor protein
VGVRKKKSNPAGTEPTDPYLKKLLRSVSRGKKLLDYKRDCPVFSQGEKADAIYFVQSGKVKITVVSAAGKEAVLSIVTTRHFFGEGCLVGQTVRVSNATTIEPSTIFRVEKSAMLRALRDRPEIAREFITALLIRNIHLEEDLCDQLFNPSERRLARVLLKLSQMHERSTRAIVRLPKISHEILAEMVGTTRPRVTQFMNKFRKIGMIDYNGALLTVRPDLLSDIVLRD